MSYEEGEAVLVRISKVCYEVECLTAGIALEGAYLTDVIGTKVVVSKLACYVAAYRAGCLLKTGSCRIVVSEHFAVFSLTNFTLSLSCAGCVSALMSFFSNNYLAAAIIYLSVSCIGDYEYCFACVLFGVDLAVSCAANLTSCNCHAGSLAAVVLLGESSLFAVTAVYGIVLGSGGNPLDITCVVGCVNVAVRIVTLGTYSGCLTGRFSAFVLTAVAAVALAVFIHILVLALVSALDTLVVVPRVLCVLSYNSAAAGICFGMSVCIGGP